MKLLLSSIFLLLISSVNAQPSKKGDTYFTQIDKATGNVIIKRGNVIIGKIEINVNAKSQIYLTGINEVKDTFGLRHTILYFIRTDNNPSLNAFLDIKFSDEALAAKIDANNSIMMTGGGLSSDKKEYSLQTSSYFTEFKITLHSVWRLHDFSFIGLAGAKLN
jgi:hypothetical protein